VNHIKDVHKLTLILVDSLNKHVIHCIKTNVDSLGLLDVMLKLFLAVILNLRKLLDKFRI
jgi:hypothetical protein